MEHPDKQSQVLQAVQDAREDLGLYHDLVVRSPRDVCRGRLSAMHACPLVISSERLHDSCI